MKEILLSAIALLEAIRPLKDTGLNNSISDVVRKLTEKFLDDSLANCGALPYGMTQEEKKIADERTWSNRARFDYDKQEYIGGYVYHNRILAIKLVRNRLSLGLKEAKDLVDAYIAKDGGQVARNLKVGV